jgi:hypothetical protein
MSHRESAYLVIWNTIHPVDLQFAERRGQDHRVPPIHVLREIGDKNLAELKPLIYPFNLRPACA